MARFQVKPMLGIIEPKNNREVEFAPKPSFNSNGWNKFDHIAVHCATAPKGNLWKATEIWQQGPKDVKRFEIKLRTGTAAAAPPPPRPKPIPVQIPPPAPPKPRKARTPSSTEPQVDLPTEPYMEPNVATIGIPCNGQDDDNIALTIHNPTSTKYTWRVKGSKMQLFICSPKWGFLDAHDKATLDCQPIPIPNASAFNEQDHFLILMAKAPNGDFTPDELWGGKCQVKLNQNKTLKVKLRALVRR